MKKLTEQFNTAVVRKGENFTLVLEGNPSAGYLWETEVLSGQVSVVKRSIIAKDSSFLMVGGPCLEQTVYKAEEEGTIHILAAWKRPHADQPLKTKSFMIHVV
jgi:predicted secreted protein